MADPTETPGQTAPAAEKPQPNGPGLMLLFGLAAIGVACWCGKDFFFPPKDWGSSSVWFNGLCMVAGVAVGIYCFVMAVRRSHKPATAADASKPPEPDA